MKKYLGILSLVVLFLVTGCTKVETGEYKEGTYMGSVQTESYGKKYVTTAVLYVNEEGVIKSCYIDSTYVKNEVNTTKKVLGNDYEMKVASPIKKEWFEQIKVIEEKVVAEQNMDWVKWTDDNNTMLDSVSGVTITADGYIGAVEKALAQAK